jgi:predicted NBD/HSP70 family sugar kinase
VGGLKHQKEKRSMDHFAGLDVSVKDTSVCIVDDTGKITREVKVAREPDALLTVLKILPTINGIFRRRDRAVHSLRRLLAAGMSNSRRARRAS